MIEEKNCKRLIYIHNSPFAIVENEEEEDEDQVRLAVEGRDARGADGLQQRRQAGGRRRLAALQRGGGARGFGAGGGGPPARGDGGAAGSLAQDCGQIVRLRFVGFMREYARRKASNTAQPGW